MLDRHLNSQFPSAGIIPRCCCAGSASGGIRAAADVIEAAQSHALSYLTFVAALIASLIASAAAENTVIDDATIQCKYTFSRLNSSARRSRRRRVLLEYLLFLQQFCNSLRNSLMRRRRCRGVACACGSDNAPLGHQGGGMKVDRVPGEVACFGSPQAVPEGYQDHSGVAVAVAITFGGLDQLLDLGLG
jgi:hypothetical protein